MWIGKATAAGSTAIICITIIKTAACPYFSSVRVWESASWHSVSAITGAATTRVGPGTAGRTIGCIGRRRRGVPGRRSARTPRLGRTRRPDRIPRLGRGRRWIARQRTDPIVRATAAGHHCLPATAAVRRGRTLSPGRARMVNRRRINDPPDSGSESRSPSLSAALARASTVSTHARDCSVG